MEGRRPTCTQCGGALRPLKLAGHYGQGVEIDLCAPCHMLWFDTVESARLSGPGLLALIGEMAAAQTLPHHAATAAPACPRCGGSVHAVHNRTRWGQSLQLECAQGHGTWQTFAQFMAEKGLLRPMSLADRHRAHQAGRGLHCVNCGGAVAERDEACTWCGSVPALVDVARLAHALDPERATEGQAVHQTAARGTALACAACGAAQPAELGWQCVACNATLATTGLAEAHRAVQSLGPALRNHAVKPAPHVVQQRLAAQQPGVERERQRAEQWKREAEDAQRGAGWPLPVEEPRTLWDWYRWLDAVTDRAGLVVLAALAVGVLLWAGFFSG